jgi:hypothetical protein
MNYQSISTDRLFQLLETASERLSVAKIKQAVLIRLKRNIEAGLSAKSAIGMELTDSLDAERYDREHLARLERELEARQAAHIESELNQLELFESATAA